MDLLLVAKGLCQTIDEAKALILAGKIWSGQTRLDKAGVKYAMETPLEIEAPKSEFVSRGGEKLKFALQHFNVSVEGKTCLDIGASTGGFTHCLLKSGADHVFAVDVGYGQIDQRFRNHDHVSVFERTHAKDLTRQTILLASPKGQQIDFLCADVSFIHLHKVLTPLRKNFPEVSDWVVLFKPQFEVSSENLLKGGIVRSQEAADRALSEFKLYLATQGFILRGSPIESPIQGKKSGNIEYLLYFSTQTDNIKPN